MKRRHFFRNGALTALGAAILPPYESLRAARGLPGDWGQKKAKNIIMLISDGMSSGTLNMADLYLSRKTGKESTWLGLYREQKVSRALMDMASASSIVTDSAAASSSWGSGVRVKNGRLNIGEKGEPLLPLWQKFRAAGKMAGCVTTVPVTHATPAGFCVSHNSRNDQDAIAEKYLEQGFELLMGGGDDFFAQEKRPDRKDLYTAYRSKGYHVVRNRDEMLFAPDLAPLLGIFADNGLPYAKDRENNRELREKTPSLAEMTKKAISVLKDHPQGFVLQVEAGRVDWAAHGNDIAGLLYDQVAMDEAITVAMGFAERDGETLVIITSDHGNANPGVIYGSKANIQFDSIQFYKHTNEWILNGVGRETAPNQLRERVAYANGFALTEEEAKLLLGHYKDLDRDEALYNPKKLPFRALAEIQKNHNSVGWISMDHSADYVELAMYGPGSRLLKPFVKNTDLHHLMLEAAEVQNTF